ncbi:hypothetical protein [Endozoicomonas sp. G2_1]|nr:hypothetical protein [Endozoicomonas sp. G2_1]
MLVVKVLLTANSSKVAALEAAGVKAVHSLADIDVVLKEKAVW